MNTKKKLLFVIPNLTSGGAEKSLVSLLAEIDYTKYDVDLLLLYQNDMFFLPQIPKNVNVLFVCEKTQYILAPITTALVLCLRSLNFRLVRVRLSIVLNRFMRMVLKNNAKLRKHEWEYITANIPFFYNEYDIAIGYLQATSIYYVVDKVHAKKKIGWFHSDYNNGRYNKDFDYRFFEQLDVLFTVSSKCAAILNEIFPSMTSKIKVMHNIVNPELVRKKSTQGSGFKDNYRGIRILTIGRLVKLKGFDIILDACERLVKSSFNFKWYIIGKGPEKVRIQREIKKRQLEQVLVLVGEVTNPYPYIKEADMYVQPSRYEGHSIAIEEAKALCKPIIVTNWDTVTSQISHRKDGYIVEMNSQAVYDGIATLITNETIRQSLITSLQGRTSDISKNMEELYKLLG